MCARAQRETLFSDCLQNLRSLVLYEGAVKVRPCPLRAVTGMHFQGKAFPGKGISRDRLMRSGLQRCKKLRFLPLSPPVSVTGKWKQISVPFSAREAGLEDVTKLAGSAALGQGWKWRFRC